MLQGRIKLHFDGLIDRGGIAKGLDIRSQGASKLQFQILVARAADIQNIVVHDGPLEYHIIEPTTDKARPI